MHEADKFRILPSSMILQWNFVCSQLCESSKQRKNVVHNRASVKTRLSRDETNCMSLRQSTGLPFSTSSGRWQHL